MRQHRDHTVRKIHACSSLKRLPVKGAVLLHIICHIGDMNAKDVILPIHPQGYRIVQIFCILAVYCHHQPFPQVSASRTVGFAYRLSDTYCLIQHFLRKFCRDSGIHHNRHDIRSRIIYVPDDLHDLSLRLHMFAAVGCKAHHDLMTGHGAHLFPLRDINVFQVSLVIRTHESEASALFVETDYVYHAMGENSDNLSFLPPSGRS